MMGPGLNPWLWSPALQTGSNKLLGQQPDRILVSNVQMD